MSFTGFGNSNSNNGGNGGGFGSSTSGGFGSSTSGGFGSTGGGFGSTSGGFGSTGGGFGSSGGGFGSTGGGFGSTSSGFGATGSGFGNANPPTSGFGAPQTSSWGTPAGGFGSTAGFGAPASSFGGGGFGSSSGFGTPTTSTFGQSTYQPSAGFGQPSSSIGSFAQPGPARATRPSSSSSELWKHTCETYVHKDSISEIDWATNSDTLAAVSWDGMLTLHAINNSRPDQWSSLRLQQNIQNAPLLCCAFGPSEATIYCGSANSKITVTDSNTGQTTAVGKTDCHKGAVRCMRRYDDTKIITASFDQSVFLWADHRLGAELKLKSRPVAMDVCKHHLVVAMEDGYVDAYDLRQIGTPLSHEKNSLKNPLRAVAISPSCDWYACSSTTGRCSVNYFNRRPGSDFSFKCHRKGNDVFVVNGITFHPSGAFVTCGNDNAVMFWDEGSRQRLANKPVPADMLPSQLGGLVDVKFSRTGQYVATAAAYDWSRGPLMRYPESAIILANTPGYAVRLRPRRR